MPPITIVNKYPSMILEIKSSSIFNFLNPFIDKEIM